MKLMRMMILILSVSLLAAGCNEKEQGQAQGKEQGQAQGQAQKENKSKPESEQEGPKYIHAHYIEEELEMMPEVEHSIAILHEQHAYISVELRDGVTDITEDLKNKLVSSVRTTEPNIHNIYISQNQDLRTRFHGLAREIERGAPEKSIGETLDQAVRKFFPELKR